MFVEDRFFDFLFLLFLGCFILFDIIMVLDVLGSVCKENWVKSVDFVVKLVKKLFVLNIESCMGIIDFSVVFNEVI